MKVILLEDVKKVGKKNEIIETSLGYGQNFLIKNKKAVEANDANLRKLNELLKHDQEEHDAQVKAAQKLKDRLEKKVFEFHLNLGNNGNVFGKISTKQIVKKLEEEGFTIDRKKVRTDGVSHLGEEEVEIELHKEVIAKIKINVIGD